MYPMGPQHDKLLILFLDRITEESKCEVHSGLKHSVPNTNLISECRSETWDRPYCDSVRKTGTVFVFVKFWSKNPYLIRVETPRSSVNGQHISQLRSFRPKVIRTQLVPPKRCQNLSSQRISPEKVYVIILTQT